MLSIPEQERNFAKRQKAADVTASKSIHTREQSCQSNVKVQRGINLTQG